MPHSLLSRFHLLWLLLLLPETPVHHLWLSGPAWYSGELAGLGDMESSFLQTPLNLIDVIRAAAASLPTMCPQKATSCVVEPCPSSLEDSEFVCPFLLLPFLPDLLLSELCLHLPHHLESGSWASRGHCMDQPLKLEYCWGFKGSSYLLFSYSPKPKSSLGLTRVVRWIQLGENWIVDSQSARKYADL